MITLTLEAGRSPNQLEVTYDEDGQAAQYTILLPYRICQVEDFPEVLRAFFSPAAHEVNQTQLEDLDE